MRKIVYIIIVILILIYFITLNDGGINLNLLAKGDKFSNYITDKVENDQDLVKEYFALGMPLSSFKATITQETEYLAKSGDAYQPITYNFEKALRYFQIEDIIKKLNNSKAVNAEIIGWSVDQRNLYSLEIGYGKRLIMFEAGIHAAEVANPLFIIKYIVDLVNAYESGDEAIIKLLNTVKIVVMPLVNPDGYEATLFGYSAIYNQNLHISKNHQKINYITYKANANGVDLNRSNPSQHGGLYLSSAKLSSSVSRSPSLGKKDYYAGEVLGSEPETRALIYWQYQYISKAYAYIALHSAGRVIYAGKPNLAAKFNQNCAALATIVNAINGYEILGLEYEDIGTGEDGTATDLASELAAGFRYSTVSGRLSASSYENPKIKNNSKIGIITIETLEKYTFDIKTIKQEYNTYFLDKVFTALIQSYQELTK